MTTIEIVSIEKDTIVGTGERFLDVRALLTDGKKKYPRNYGYPLNTPKKVIEKDLKAALKLYDDEKATAAAQEEAEATETAADKTIESLKGVSISND